MHSTVIKSAAERQEGDVTIVYLHLSADTSQQRALSLDSSQNTLTNNSSGSVDDVPRGLRRDLSTRVEEQLDGEGLAERTLLRAGLVAAVTSTYGHLLPFHQLHQLLRLAGRTQGAWLVPVEGGKYVRVQFSPMPI